MTALRGSQCAAFPPICLCLLGACGTQYYVVSTYGDLQLLPKLTYGRLFVRPSEAYKTCSNKLHQFTMHAISSCSLRIFKDDKEIFIMTALRGASGATFLVTLFGAVFDRIRENARGVLNSKCTCIKIVFPEWLRFSGGNGLFRIFYTSSVESAMEYYIVSTENSRNTDLEDFLCTHLAVQ
ncbi:hypothetical protein C8J57DRAFT_1258614 [Mycena rebaudengoi]|nr:hypothetical protein C8J57DRAFT_1258614 [Mycena rebaudengoi]